MACNEKKCQGYKHKSECETEGKGLMSKYGPTCVDPQSSVICVVQECFRPICVWSAGPAY